MIRIHNVETDEIIDRPMTDREFAEYQKEFAKIQTEDAAKAALEVKKQEVLAKLGLTADEVSALLA